MAILSKGCKPDNFESKNSPKLSLRNIWVFPWITLIQTQSNLSPTRHSCSMWDKPWWLNWFWQILCEGLPSLYVKEGLPFAWDLSLENAADSYLCFQLTEVKVSVFPGGNFMPKFNNRNTRTGCTICSKLTMKTLKWYQTLFLCLYC